MFEISVGSKVFLLGEYQVLKGGAALVISLEPRFKLLVKAGSGKLVGISEASPAGRYFQQEFVFFQQFDLTFVDPHQGRGGFGASTAQMALLQGLRDGYESFKSQSQVNLDLRKIHKKYLELATTSTGVPPSGADLLAQLRGGLVEVDLGAGKIQWQAWPFPQWQMLFFSTGRKLATHEHLSGLKDIDVTDLREVYQKTMKALTEVDAEAFAQGLRDYQWALAEHEWQSSETAILLNRIYSLSGVVAAKGCGAMGADVVAVLVQKPHAETLKNAITQLGATFVGDLDNRTEGFAYQWYPSPTASPELPQEPACL